MAPSSPRWPLLILLAAVTAVFQSVSGFGFVWDDHLLIQDNALLRGPINVVEFFRADLWASTPDPDPNSGYYRPMFLLDMALTRVVGGPGPGAAHVHSLLWHLLAVVGVFALLRQLIETPWAAACGAAVFALHPVQVEAVGFISARNDSMAAALLVWALIPLSRTQPSRRGLVGGGLLVLAALLSKESVVLAPVMLALIARARGPGWGTIQAHVAVVTALAVGLGLRAWADVGMPAQADAAHLWGAAGPTMVHVLDRLIWPHALAPMVHLGWPPPLPVVSAAVAASLGGALVFLGRRRAGLGLAFSAIGLAPALAGVAHTGIIVDRYMYLPMVGVAVMVASAAARLPRLHAVFAAVCGCLIILTAQHLPTWESDETLWQSAMSRAPSAYAAGAYARGLEDEGKLEQAAHYYVLATAPPRPFPTGCFNVTRVHLALGRPDQAITAGAAALEAGCERSAELLAPMALALALTAQWDAAETLASEVEDDPTGKTVIIELAAAARRGDMRPLNTEAAAVDGLRAQALRQQVATLIAFAGEPGLAEQVRGASAPD